MFSTTSLLRPEQRQELADEKTTLTRKLSNPYIQDKPAVHQQLRRLTKQIDESSPKPPIDVREEEKMHKREQTLRDEILEGMPSQEEMRKCPPGAIGKHQAWEKKNKVKLLEWKHIRLRQNSDDSDPDIANFERHRPARNTLNMDNAQIQGKDYYLPSEAYKENYDEIFRKEEKKFDVPKGLSAEQRKAQSERMKKRHADNRAKKAAQAAKGD